MEKIRVFTRPMLWAALSISLLPFLLNVIGITFENSSEPLPTDALGPIAADAVFRSLSGAFTHTILEWTAVSAALFTVPLAYVNSLITRKPAILVIGIALFCAGSMDAFHTLAAARLITAVAPNSDLIPFTWAMSRIFNATILVVGVGLILRLKKEETKREAYVLMGLSVAFVVVAYSLIQSVALLPSLPQTQFPGNLVTRPYDVLPLVLFFGAGVWLFPKYYKATPTIFTFALAVSVIPQVAAQLHMAFGSSALFDNHFNIAHFLKIVAYAIPFLGLTLDYVKTHRERQAADQAKSDFLASMSHEMRTPLNAVIGMSEILSETKLDRQQQEYLARIGRSGDALLSLVNDVLDISKIEANEIDLESAPFDLDDLMDRTMEIIALRAHAKGLELVHSVDPAVPIDLVGDEYRIQQVLLNLIGNAIKFTDAGQVTVRVSTTSQGGDAPLRILFEVRDTGLGIPPERLEAVFESFTQADTSVTRRFGGTGLGLTISKRLVELMGGTISVTSVVGTGSTFSFTIPRKVVDGSPRRYLPAGPKEISGLKVLVVDDTEENRIILQAMLEEWEAEVDVVASGGDALELLKRRATEGMPFDLVLLDVRMPGMDGFTVAEKIRSEAGVTGTMIMMLTSDTRSGDVEKVRNLAAAYLMKPIRRRDLIAAIQETLGRLGGHPEESVSRSEGNDHLPPSRILVVEDSETNWLVFQAYLESLGMSAVHAENGAIAVELVKAGDFDLILMDLQMPEMDGYEATEAIRLWETQTSAARIPIIALTAHAMKQRLERAIDSGCDAYLTKPLRKQALARVLSEYLGGEKMEGLPEAPEDFPEVGDVVLTWEAPLRDLADKIMDGRRGELQQVSEALERGDLDSIRQLAHAMRGAPDMGPITAATLDLEAAAEVGDANGAAVQVNRLKDMFSRVEIHFDDE